MSYRELLLGVGNSNKKEYFVDDHPTWENVTTLDMNAEHNPDVVWDLNVRPLPFEDETFDEIHAYDVLEHIGRQGDYKGFFEEFEEYWRILKPGGLLVATVPSGMKAVFSDPGHTRVINELTLVFLSQKEYVKQVGITKMTDYRNIWKKDFDIMAIKRDDTNHSLAFMLRKSDA